MDLFWKYFWSRLLWYIGYCNKLGIETLLERSLCAEVQSHIWTSLLPYFWPWAFVVFERSVPTRVVGAVFFFFLLWTKVALYFEGRYVWSALDLPCPLLSLVDYSIFDSFRWHTLAIAKTSQWAWIVHLARFNANNFLAVFSFFARLPPPPSRLSRCLSSDYSCRGVSPVTRRMSMIWSAES